MRKYTSLLLALSLTLLSLAIFAYKHFELKFPLSPSEQYDSWYIEARLNFHGDQSFLSDLEDSSDKPVSARLYLPRPQEKLALVQEQFSADGFGVEKQREENNNRLALFTKRQASRNEVIYYRALFYELDSPVHHDLLPEQRPKAHSPYRHAARSSYVPGENTDPMLDALHGIIADAREKAADKLSLIKALAREAATKDERDQIISSHAPEAKTDAGLLALILNTAGLPARVMHGLPLQVQTNDQNLMDWTEVWYNDRWQPIDMENFQLGFKKPHLAWWTGDTPPFDLQGGKDANLTLSVKRNTDNALQRAIWQSGEKASLLTKFSLLALPVSTQLLFQIMLMIPIGGLVIAFLRQVVGVKTFGTFMPVLVALAFRETGVFAGVVTFCIIVFFGLVIRSWFHHLQLLMVPRLTAVLTIVVLIICFIALFAQNLGITLGLSLSLFPIVVLTMTIERMSTMWDESGPKEAISIGLGSLASAVLCYFVLTSVTLTHLVFIFPELLLIVLALSILMGRYNGYKLSEYARFRALQRSIAAKRLHLTKSG